MGVEELCRTSLCGGTVEPIATDGNFPLTNIGARALSKLYAACESSRCRYISSEGRGVVARYISQSIFPYCL